MPHAPLLRLTLLIALPIALVLVSGCSGEVTRAGLVEDGGDDGPPQTVDGWTEIERQPGAVVIHLSNSGDDANPGTEDAPKASFRAGYEALRDGQADELLLERGGTWTLDDIFQWAKSGPAADDAGWMHLGAYGDESRPRPRLNSGTVTALAITPGFQATRPLTHFAMTDIHVVAQGRLDNRTGAPEGATGLQTVAFEYRGSGSPIQHVLFENLRIEGYSFGYSGGRDVEDLRVRRCIFTEIFNPGGNGTHGSALLSDANGLLLEDNVFYRIQHPDMPGVSEISSFAHSAYIGAEANNVVARGNIIIKATEGFMQRAGGTFERNVSAFNDLAHLSGQAFGVLPRPGGIEANIRDNLFLNANSSMMLGNTASGMVRGNLFLRGSDGSQPFGVSLIERNPGQGGENIGVHDVTFEDNRLSGDFTYGGNSSDTSSFSGLVFTNNSTMVGVTDTAFSELVSAQGLSGDVDVYGRDLITRDRQNFRDRHKAVTIINHYRQAVGMSALD